MWIDFVAVLQIDPEVRHFMNIRDEEKVLIEVVIERDPGVVFRPPACKVPNLSLAAFGHLELEGALFPKGEAIVQR